MYRITEPLPDMLLWHNTLDLSSLPAGFCSVSLAGFSSSKLARIQSSEKYSRIPFLLISTGPRALLALHMQNLLSHLRPALACPPPDSTSPQSTQHFHLWMGTSQLAHANGAPYLSPQFQPQPFIFSCRRLCFQNPKLGGYCFVCFFH